MRPIVWILPSCAMLLCSGCTTRLDPTAFIEHYMELHRSGDVDGLLALHTADAEFLIVGQNPMRGTAALRDLFEFDAVLGSELVMDAISVDGDTIVVDSIIERNKLFEAIGVSESRYRPGTRIVFRGGRISGTYPATFDDETQKRVAEGFRSPVRWLASNRPSALEQLLPGGKFRYDAASARLWLEVLAEWNNSQRQVE